MENTTTIVLNDHFEDFIKQEVKSGKYKSASEVVVSALKLLEEEEKKMQELIAAIEKGEQSGYVEDFDPDKFLEDLNCRYNERKKI